MRDKILNKVKNRRQVGDTYFESSDEISEIKKSSLQLRLSLNLDLIIRVIFQFQSRLLGCPFSFCSAENADFVNSILWDDYWENF